MLFTFNSTQDAAKVASRALFLAYNASGVFGMGAFRAQENVTEEQVLDNVMRKGDYPAYVSRMDSDELHADYVFGRMMKLRINVVGETVSVSDDKPRSGYQSWSVNYKSYKALIKAAMKELKIKEVVLPEQTV